MTFFLQYVKFKNKLVLLFSCFVCFSKISKNVVNMATLIIMLSSSSFVQTENKNLRSR